MLKALKSFLLASLVFTVTFSLFACGGDDVEPSAEAFAMAYEEKIEELMDDVGNYYSLVDNYNMSDMSTDAEVSVNLSSDLLHLIRSNTSYDFKWVNDAKLQISSNSKNNITSNTLGLTYKNAEVFSAQAIMNFANEEIFFNIPSLSETFAKLEMEEGGTVMIDFMTGADISKLLPDEALLEKVLKDIFSTIAANIENLEFVEKEISANGVKQSCIAYKASFSEKDLVKTGIEVLKMLKNSSDFKDLISEFVKGYNDFAEKMGYDEMKSSSFVYNNLVDVIKDVIEEMEDTLRYLKTSEMLVWTSYITDDLDIIGTNIDVSYGGSYATLNAVEATDGDDVGVEIYFKKGKEKLVGIYGKLDDNGDEISGTYEIKVSGKSMAFIDLKDVDADKLDDGYFIGSVSISPSKGLLDKLGVNSDYSVAGLVASSLSLQIDVLENNEDEFKVTVSLMSGSSPYASITIAAEVSAGTKVSVPSKSEDLERWVYNLDWDDFADQLEDSGLPDYVVDTVLGYLFGY